MIATSRFANSTQGLAKLGRAHPQWTAAVLLFVAQSVISIGLWNAGVPLGDEGVHILRAYSINSNPKTWTSPFHDIYALLLWAIGDPVSGHLVYRFILAQTTVLVLWRVMRSMGLSWNAATLACVCWIGCGVANPLIHDWNISLFCFSLAGYGLSLVLDRASWLRTIAT